MDDQLRIEMSAGRISLIGEMTQFNVKLVEQALRDSDALEVDLRALTFVDSAGMAVLLHAIESRPGLRIVGPRSNVARVFELSGLSHVFDAALTTPEPMTAPMPLTTPEPLTMSEPSIPLEPPTTPLSPSPPDLLSPPAP